MNIPNLDFVTKDMMKVEIISHQSDRDQFWRDCVLELIKTHRGTFPTNVLNEADFYLEEYDERFNPQTGTKVVSKEKSD